MDVFLFTKSESEPITVFYKLSRKSNFKEITCKLRQCLNMILLNLAQDPMGIISGPLILGLSITLNACLHCLGKGIGHHGFFKATNFLKNQKFVALKQKMPTVSHGYFFDRAYGGFSLMQ